MPASARFKVYIIDEAHQITSDAFNALLKLVEEPPQHLKFVFATTEPDKVLQTIRSRTHHYAFRLVPPAMLREFLAKVCVDEGAEVDPAVLPLVVRAGAGSVRDSLSVLDQLLAGAGPDGLTAAHAAALLGLSDASVLDDAVEALAAKAPAGRVLGRRARHGDRPRSAPVRDGPARARTRSAGAADRSRCPGSRAARRVRARPDRADALAGRPDGRRRAVARRRAAAQRPGRDARHDQPAADARAGALARAAARSERRSGRAAGPARTAGAPARRGCADGAAPRRPRRSHQPQARTPPAPAPQPPRRLPRRPASPRRPDRRPQPAAEADRAEPGPSSADPRPHRRTAPAPAAAPEPRPQQRTRRRRGRRCQPGQRHPGLARPARRDRRRPRTGLPYRRRAARPGPARRGPRHRAGAGLHARQRHATSRSPAPPRRCCARP